MDKIPPFGTVVIFRDIDHANPDRENPAKRGTVARLKPESNQIGIAYEEGITKVWVCIEDVEIRDISL